MLPKPALRQQMRQLLREVPQGANAALIEALKRAAVSWSPNQTVAIFGGLRGEADLVGEFLPWLLASGHRAVLFGIDSEKLTPRLVSGTDDLRRGVVGAWEPRADLPIVEVSALDIIIVPGLAFSPAHLSRLGRGGGYYDRLLADPRCRAHRIALAHDFQRIDEIPTEPHDQKVHEIISP
jgi:5-formyltetrahydrofolate cyclo-ligase